MRACRVQTRLNELLEALGAIEHKQNPLTTPTPKPVVESNCTRTCRHHEKKGKRVKLGNGYCDVQFNHCGCDYDRGDCCMQRKHFKTKKDKRECSKNPEKCCCVDPNDERFGLGCPTTIPPPPRATYHPDDLNISIHLGAEDINISLIEEEILEEEEGTGGCVDVVARGLLHLLGL